MRFVEASTGSLLAFGLVVAAVLGCLVAGLYDATWHETGQQANARRAALRLAAGLAGWIVLTALWVRSGLVLQSPIPFLPLTFAVANGVAIAFGLSPAGRTLAMHLPLAALVAFQGFRLPLELVLHSWAAQGTIPETMTWTGSNVDIITGIVALAAAPFARHGRAAAWVANVIGILLLVNVARVAVLSSPLPFAWPVDPPLLLIAYMPYALIGTVCVAGATAGHVILTRRLLRG